MQTANRANINNGSDSDPDSLDSFDAGFDEDESDDLPSAGDSQNTWANEPANHGYEAESVHRPQKDQLPNPIKDRHALLLGSFSLPVKVRMPVAAA
jgi:hypothetical protein